MHYVILHIVLRHIPSYTLSAGVAQGDIHLRFAWQAWHLWHWVARLGWFWSPVTPRHFEWQARHKVTSHLRFTWQARHNGHIHLRFAWQAWHVWHWVAHLGWFWSPVTPRHFEWQARHKVTSTFVSRGRRGTWSHPRWFHVAGVALMALGGALGLVLVAHDAAALWVAGAALGHILHSNRYNYIQIHYPVACHFKQFAPPRPSDIVLLSASDHPTSRRRTPWRRLVPEGLPAGPVFTQWDIYIYIYVFIYLYIYIYL